MASPPQVETQEQMQEDTPMPEEVKSEHSQLSQKVEENQSEHSEALVNKKNNFRISFKNCDSLRDLVITPLQRAAEVDDLVKHYKCIIPKAVAKPIKCQPSKIDTKWEKDKAYERLTY